MDILSQSALILSLTSLGYGASMLARNIRNKLFLAFGMFCFLIFGWSFAYFLSNILESQAFYSLHLVFNIWLTPLGIAFIQVYLKQKDAFTRQIFNLAATISFALTVCLGLKIQHPSVDFLVRYSPGILAIEAVYLLIIERRLSRPLRASFIYTGAIFAVLTCVMDHVPILGKVIPSIGNIFLAAYLFFLSQAIAQQRLLNVGALISRFLVLLVVALVLTGLYLIIFSWIENNLPILFLNSFIVSFLLLMLLDPIRSMVEFLTRSLLTKEHRQLESQLVELNTKLAQVLRPEVLYDQIFNALIQVLSPQSFSIFVLDSNEICFQKVRGRNKVSDILVDHPLMNQCRKLSESNQLPVLFDQHLQNEMERSASRSEREYLKLLMESLHSFSGNLLIPFISQRKILGFAILTVSSPPAAWGHQWGLLPGFYPYFERVAAQMQSMEIYAKQREKERLATLGEMAAGLAHEIRNPLGAIKGAAQLLDPAQERPESPFLKIIIEEVDRLNHVVSQFLEYSKTYSPQLERIDLAALVEKTLKTLDAAKPDPNILIKYDLPKQPSWVLGSTIPLQQVLYNLLQNSIHALTQSKTEGGYITVSVAGSSFTVIDNGPGISKDKLDKIFIPFFTTSPSGTGLGLSICQKIIESHGGNIEVYSEPGKLTRFRVVLKSQLAHIGHEAHP